MAWLNHSLHIINFHAVSSGKGYCGCQMNQHKIHSCWKQIDLIYVPVAFISMEEMSKKSQPVFGCHVQFSMHWVGSKSPEPIVWLVLIWHAWEICSIYFKLSEHTLCLYIMPAKNGVDLLNKRSKILAFPEQNKPNKRQILGFCPMRNDVSSSSSK